MHGADSPDSGMPPAPRGAGLLRNVALVGHSAAGKTTLAEALLLRAGAVPRAGRVEDGTTTCDSDPVGQRLGHSVALSVAALEWQGVKLNLLDTPGSPDFVGELRAGLRAADGVLFVVSAVGGLDAVTGQLWQECARLGVPRAVVVTQLDRPRADFDETVALCQRVLDEGVLPVHLPMHDDDGTVGGLISLLDQTVADSSTGERVVRPADPEHVKLVESVRAELIEAVIGESEDETLLDRYLDGEDLDLPTLHADLHTAVARGHLHPALGVSALDGVGLDELLGFLVEAFPSPLEHPVPPITHADGSPVVPATCDPDGPLLAEVIKTTTDAHLGRVSYVRVFSGTLQPDTAVHVCGHGAGGPWQREDHPDHDVEARVGPLASPLGAALRPVASCPAGDICTVTRLTAAETGDTLSDPRAPLLIGPWALPEPQLPIAVEAASRSEQERFSAALARVVTEDPTVRLERRADTGQQLLWTVGTGHAEVLLERLRSRSGVEVLTPAVEIAHRETLAGSATGTGRHVKQSGGHGQYAVVEVEVEPAPPGSGVVFEQRVVGGTVPTAFHGSVEKGVRAQAERGVSPAGPLVDVKVVLVGGKAHAVDSSDAAFQTAGGLALREAAAVAGTRLLEPWCEVEVHVPSAFVGSTMSDLSGRRARVTSSEPDPEDDELTVVRAALPEAELLGYSVALRKVSHGTGRFSRRELGFEPAVPG